MNKTDTVLHIYIYIYKEREREKKRERDVFREWFYWNKTP